MASFTEISNATLAEGEPIKASTQLALRDNPIAIAEGRPDAPSVSPWAFARATVSTGSTIRYRDPSKRFFDETEWRTAFAVSTMNDGNVTVEWTMNRTSGTGSIRAELYRDRAGTATIQGSMEQTGPSVETYSRTVAIEPGDTIYLNVRMQDSGADGEAYDFTIKTNGELLHPVPPWFRYGTAPV